MLFDWQRGQVTPLGHRKAANCSLHFSSLPNCAKSFGRFMSALKDLVGFLFIIMPRSKKPAHKMTDKELLHSNQKDRQKTSEAAQNNFNHATKLALCQSCVK